MHVEIYVQARMGSTRLPGKVMMPILKKPMLYYQLERLKASRQASSLVVLTTALQGDDAIANFCATKDIPCIRGSSENVLDRFYQAAYIRRPDAIVRITADCPIIDPQVVDEVISAYLLDYPKWDYASNCLVRTFPRGMDVEVFSFYALERAFFHTKRKEDQEHVTPYIIRHKELFRLKNVSFKEDLSKYRWTVDTPEDFSLIKLLIEHLFPKNPLFTLEDALALLKKYPEWGQINAHIQQK